jgi:hypothetical protein
MVNLEILHFIKLHVSGFPFQLKINGGPVLFFDSDSGCSVHMSVQQWIQPGLNQLEVFPLETASIPFPKYSRIDATIFLGPSIEETPIARLTQDMSNYPHEEREFNLHLSFENKSNVAPLKWSKSPVIAANERVLSELLSIYNDVFSAIQNKNLNGLITLFKERSIDLAKRQGQDLSEFEDALREQISSRFENPSYTAWPMRKERLRPVTYADGKLICLETPDGCSPLLLFNETEMISSYFPIYLYRPAEGEPLTIIR